MTPTPEQIRERNEAWARALDENPRKCKGQMRDGRGGRCCLAVAQDVALELGMEWPIDPATGEKASEGAELPWDGVAEFFGWFGPNPFLRTDQCVLAASIVNDGQVCREHTHKEIAALVRAEFCGEDKP